MFFVLPGTWIKKPPLSPAVSLDPVASSCRISYHDCGAVVTIDVFPSTPKAIRELRRGMVVSRHGERWCILECTQNVQHGEVDMLTLDVRREQ